MKQTNLEWLISLDEREMYDEFYGARAKFSARHRTSLTKDAKDFILWLASPHTEPIVLTAEERKAAELAVAIGLPWIRRIPYGSSCETMLIAGTRGFTKIFDIQNIPNIRGLLGCQHIAETPTYLCELLKADNNG